MRGAAAAVGTMLLVCAACGGDDHAAVAGVEVGDGLSVEVVLEGLSGPTQIAPDGSGGVVVAELNGGERDGTGRVVRYRDLDAPTADVLATDLVAPTGVTVDRAGRLWIMEQRRLSVATLDEPTDRTVVLDELPFNGRSEGTITALDDGSILYDTSGSRDPDRPGVLKPDHGVLWRLADPTAGPTPVATGLKHAYAHVVDADGVLWSTEMSDGRLDGVVPPDELVAVEPGDDFGYPRCVGDRTPVAELGADEATCSDTPRSHALFEPGATPTSVAVAPWDDGVLLVALWNLGEIVAVPRSPADEPHPPTVIVSGEIVPQHLLADGDRLLVSDFAGGRILSVGRP